MIRPMMMGVPCVFGLLVLLSVSIVRTRSFVLLEEPDFNIWDQEEDNPNAEAEKLLAVLCENYLLSINNQNIDCASVQFAMKGLETDDSYHIISKREADGAPQDLEEDEEGSGNGSVPEISLYKEAPVEANNNSTSLDEPKESEPDDVQPIPQNVEEQQSSVEPENAPEEETTSPQPNLANESDQSDIKESESLPEQANKEGDNDNAEPPPSLPVPSNADELAVNETENEEAKASEHEIPRSETTIAPPTVEQISEAPATTQSPIVDSNNDEDGSRLATQKVLPSDLAEVETTTAKPKEAEVVDDQQSGNAVVLKSPSSSSSASVPVSVEGSDGDKQLAGIATNAKINNIKASETEQPNTGESSKNVAKAGKDTTILVVLFVVVIVIGAAAFTHNFMKKRRQRNSENSEAVNGIRKSLQNLSGNDVEQVTEMKPLMKTNNSPVIVKEYSDGTKTDA